MRDLPLEAVYPLSFRHEEAKILGQHLKQQHSVMLVGMKRVGISNFLRFFLYNPEIAKIYINDEKQHLFIPVDLNDLIEREVYPFWVLTFKRILDSVVVDKRVAQCARDIETLFLAAVQSNDLFLLIDGIRRSIIKITEEGVIPTIFFVRFDRISDAISPEFFANMQGLRDASHRKLTYVFTSYRPLDWLAPRVFTKPSLSVFANTIFIPPAKPQDSAVIFETYKKRYHLKFSQSTEEALLSLVDGYVQYIQLAVIALQEKQEKELTKEALLEVLFTDERISLQSEELWESLTKEEQDIVLRVAHKDILGKDERKRGEYLWKTGLITQKDTFFSPLFHRFIQQRTQKTAQEERLEFTKKEHLLFAYLHKTINEICEREQIIAHVWPEVEAFGVSDWAIDRLVARVRTKLKQTKSTYEIQTVKTRGYKLVNKG